ncbi:MAG: 30S ribosomal protein S16, partial [Lentisphaeria bacterium]|nr:30S ribosomal protein S16 [Lentisphaeria bacterium]
RLKEEKIDLEKAAKWISNGAQPSDTVKAIINRVEKGIVLEVKPSKGIQAPKKKVEEAPVAEVVVETAEVTD